MYTVHLEKRVSIIRSHAHEHWIQSPLQTRSHQQCVGIAALELLVGLHLERWQHHTLTLVSIGHTLDTSTNNVKASALQVSAYLEGCQYPTLTVALVPRCADLILVLASITGAKLLKQTMVHCTLHNVPIVQ